MTRASRCSRSRRSRSGSRACSSRRRAGGDVMRRFFAAAIEELGSGDPGALMVFTAAARPVEIEHLIAADPSGEPIVLWDEPAPEPDGRAWSFVGWGEAARLDATGATR